MKQRAEVLELRGNNALVSVRRSSMCEGCEKQGGCGSSCAAGELLGAGKTMTALASNEIGAGVGDTVEVESESRTVLGYAALVFLFPILLCAVFYLIGFALNQNESTAMLFGLLGFLSAFLVILLFDRMKKKRAKPDIRITRIL